MAVGCAKSLATDSEIQRKYSWTENVLRKVNKTTNVNGNKILHISRQNDVLAHA